MGAVHPPATAALIQVAAPLSTAAVRQWSPPQLVAVHHRAAVHRLVGAGLAAVARDLVVW